MTTLTVSLDDHYGQSLGVTVTLRFAEFDGTHNVFEWTVKDDDGSTVATATDLRCPKGDTDPPHYGMTPLADVFGTWCGFFGAWVEALDYDGSENADLFPPSLIPLAEAIDSDDPAMWAFEICGATL